MSGWYVLDEAGNPVPEPDVRRWSAWYAADDGARQVDRDEVGDATVSTVFLGLDHGYGDGRPVLWETMVFGGPLDGRQDRYTSRADAVAGHAEMLARVWAAWEDREEGERLRAAYREARARWLAGPEVSVPPDLARVALRLLDWQEARTKGDER